MLDKHVTGREHLATPGRKGEQGSDLMTYAIVGALRRGIPVRAGVIETFDGQRIGEARADPKLASIIACSPARR
jgi:hypothetical protein